MVTVAPLLTVRLPGIMATLAVLLFSVTNPALTTVVPVYWLPNPVANVPLIVGTMSTRYEVPLMISTILEPGAKLAPPTTMPTDKLVVLVPVTMSDPAVVVAFWA